MKVQINENLLYTVYSSRSMHISVICSCKMVSKDRKYGCLQIDKIHSFMCHCITKIQHALASVIYFRREIFAKAWNQSQDSY
jgi:hypothetical protein